MRSQEFPQLETIIYADYAGAMVMCKSMQKKLDELTKVCVSNPHSGSQIQSVINTTECLRSEICSLYNTNLGEYHVIFTENTTYAIKLLTETFIFSDLALHYYIDNHNSIFGLRTYAEKNGSIVNLCNNLPEPIKDKKNLFVYPMQSNFSGKKYPLEWISDFQAKNGVVLLDAAGSCSPDLSEHKPEFVVGSLLKLTGIHGGFLMVRRDITLEEPMPAGGNVRFTCARNGHYKLFDALEQKMEFGTPSYINISLALEALKVRRQIGTEKEIINNIKSIAQHFEEGLRSLVHDTGEHLVKFQPERDETFGGTFSFNFYTPEGKLINHHDLQYMFSVFDIVARFGGHCNPGASFPALNVSPEEVETAAFSNEDGDRCVSSLCLPSGKPLGTVRISFGATSTIEDADKLINIFKQQLLNGGPCPKDCGELQTPLKVEKMFVFPLAGALGFEAEKWPFTGRGFLYDRGWKLVTPDGDNVATAHCPDLAKLQALIEDDYLVLKFDNDEFRVLIENFEVDHNVPKAVSDSGLPYGPDVRDFLLRHLGRYLYLVKPTGRNKGRMAFSAMTLETAKEISPTIDIKRFRVNLILSGTPAFTEENKPKPGLSIHGIPITAWRWRIACMTTSVEPFTSKILKDDLRKFSEKRSRNGAVAMGFLFGIESVEKPTELLIGDYLQYVDN